MNTILLAFGLGVLTLLAAVLRSSDLTRRATMETQAKIDELKAGLAANTSATQSVVALMTGFLDGAEAAKDDPEELQALIDGYRANTEALAAAVAAATPAAEPGNDTETAPAGDDTLSGGQGGDTVS